MFPISSEKYITDVKSKMVLLYNDKMCRFGYNIQFDNNKSITCCAKTILSENTQINHQDVYQTPKDNS